MAWRKGGGDGGGLQITHRGQGETAEEMLAYWCATVFITGSYYLIQDYSEGMEP